MGAQFIDCAPDVSVLNIVYPQFSTRLFQLPGKVETDLPKALNGHPQIHAIACDTDGVDGAAEVAGAVIGPDTLATPGAAEALACNDAHSYFARAGAQDVTGPTLTNVNDFRAILILPPA